MAVKNHNRLHNRSMEWLVMQAHDGELQDRHRAAVEIHLAACRLCRNYVATARSTSAWLRHAPVGTGSVPGFSEIWKGIASRLPATGSPVPWRTRWPVQAWSFRWKWLAAGSLAVAMLLLLVNPYARLPVTQSHAATVAYVESFDYPVMVMMPLQPDEMTVIWLFESQPGSSLPPT
jgi:anti-sigma factor RsiW